MNTNTPMDPTSSAPAPETLPGQALTLFLPNLAGQDGLSLAITVRTISTASILLQFPAAEAPALPPDLKGLEAIIQLPAGPNTPAATIPGKVLWTRPDSADPDTCILGLEFAASLSPEVRHALEGHMEIVNKDIKELWNQWDLVHGRAASPPPAAVRVLKPQNQPPPIMAPQPASPPASSRTTYLVGFGVMGVGTFMQFLSEDYLRFSGLILIIYGSVIVAGKSLWGMWQVRRRPQIQ